MGGLVVAARSTWEEPRERRESSAAAVKTDVEVEMKARFVRQNVSLVGDNVKVSPSGDSSWNDCHVPSRAVEVEVGVSQEPAEYR